MPWPIQRSVTGETEPGSVEAALGTLGGPSEDQPEQAVEEAAEEAEEAAEELLGTVGTGTGVVPSADGEEEADRNTEPPLNPEHVPQVVPPSP